MGLLKTKAYIKNSSKVTIFLDTDIEIYIMTKKFMKNTNLAIKQRPNLEFVSHTSYNRLFFGLCEDLKVAISGLKTRYPIFVIEARDHDFI